MRNTRCESSWYKIQNKETEELILDHRNGGHCAEGVKQNCYRGYIVNIYIPKDYIEQKGYDINTIHRLLKTMNFMSLPVKYIGETALTTHVTEFVENNGYYEFLLEYKNYLTGCHALLAYQVLRLLYYNCYDGVLEELYSLKRRMPRLSYFTCLQLAYKRAPQYSNGYAMFDRIRTSEYNLTKGTGSFNIYYNVRPNSKERLLKNLKENDFLFKGILKNREDDFDIKNYIKEEELNKLIEENNYKAINEIVDADY